MKIEQKKSFKPVVITLETEEEVIAMLVAVGCFSVEKVKAEHAAEEDWPWSVDTIKVGEAYSKMYSSLIEGMTA